ncbi:MAG: flippase [Candidatus Rokubacteria bacterium]|nr:flippase [Candidatus Rokubacteria bacterium]
MTAGRAPESVQLLIGAGVVFAGQLVGRALSFFYHLLLGRVLGPVGYGAFLLGLALFTFASLLADLGLRWWVLRESATAEGRGDLGRVRGTFVGGSLVGLGGSLLAGVGLLALTPSAAAWFKASDLAWLLPVFALALPFTTLATLSVSTLQALRRPAALSVIQYLLDPLLRIAVFAGLGLLGWHLVAAAASHLLAAVTTALVGIIWLSFAFPLFSRASLEFRFGALMAFSLPLFVSNLVGFALQWADTLLLGYYLSTAEVGLYGAVGRLAGLGAMFLTAVGAVFAPKIYALDGQGDLAEVGRLYQRSTRWVLILSVPLFLYTVTNAESLLALFGQGFVEAAPALLILSVATLVMTGTGSAGDLVLMAGRSDAVLYSSLAVGALGLALNASLIPLFGLFGAAVATGLTIASSNLANVWMAWRFTGLQPYTRAIVKPILVALVVAALQLVLAPLVGEKPVPRLVAAGGIWLLYPFLLRRMGLEAEDLEAWSLISRSKLCAGSPAS